MRRKIVEFIAWLLGVSLDPVVRKQIHYIASPRATKTIDVSLVIPDTLTSPQYHKDEVAKAIAKELVEQDDTIITVVLKEDPNDRVLTLKGRLQYVSTRES